MVNKNWLYSKSAIVLGLVTLVATACAPAVTPTVTEAVPDPIEGSDPAPAASPTHDLDGEDCGDPFADGRPNFSLSYWDETNFCLHSVDYDEIFSGGPPPDGIPAIDEPVFESLEAGSLMGGGAEPDFEGLDLEGLEEPMGDDIEPMEGDAEPLEVDLEPLEGEEPIEEDPFAEDDPGEE